MGPIAGKYAGLLLAAAGLSLAAAAAGGAASAEATARRLYAVSAAANDRGSISVYDIDAGHRRIPTIPTGPRRKAVRGVPARPPTRQPFLPYPPPPGPPPPSFL